MSQLFSQQAGSDNEVFSRRLLELHILLEPQERFQLFYGTQVRARHSNHFIFAFERLLRRADAVDADHMLRDALMANAHGFVYSIAKEHQANAPAELADIERTGMHITMATADTTLQPAPNHEPS